MTTAPAILAPVTAPTITLTPLEASVWRVLVAAEGYVTRAALREAVFGRPHIGDRLFTAIAHDTATLSGVLMGMRERCAEAGVFIDSRPGKGVRLRAMLPGETAPRYGATVHVGDWPPMVTVRAEFTTGGES